MLIFVIDIRLNWLNESRERYEVAYVWIDGLTIVVSRFASREKAQNWARRARPDIEVIDRSGIQSG